MTTRKKPAERDLYDYNSPIKRADGQVPFNDHLWPTQSWWPCHTAQFRHVDSRWHFFIIELNDGRFSIDMAVWHIAHNSSDPYARPGEKPGLPVVFESRSLAIRTAAARMITALRKATRWPKAYQNGYGVLHGSQLAAVINWTLAQVAEATSQPQPRVVCIPDPLKPPQKTGLDLFDFAFQEAAHKADPT